MLPRLSLTPGRNENFCSFEELKISKIKPGYTWTALIFGKVMWYGSVFGGDV